MYQALDLKRYPLLQFQRVVQMAYQRDHRNYIIVGERTRNRGVAPVADIPVDLEVPKHHQDLRLNVITLYNNSKDNIRRAHCQLRCCHPNFTRNLTTIQIQMCLWRKRTFKNYRYQAELTQNVEGQHLSHKNGLIPSIKHV